MEQRTRVSGWQIACGRVPEHWVYSEEFSKLANDCLYFCRERLRNPKTEMKVYTGYRSHRYLGKCYTRCGVICLDEKHHGEVRKQEEVLHTLAHEVAHMAYAKHGIRHQELTEKIFTYIGRLADGKL